ncbi:MAG: chemotaxis protein CheW [Gammaproteobacteria bacterium]|nr:chemotaxis protein CheW [Gammaproteobacteria bacterium]
MNLECSTQSLLSFRVGPVLCCAPSLPVRSIITPPKLTHIAGSEPSQPGIFKHGSHIVKVLDLRLKFGVDPTQHAQPGNLVVTISEAGDFAFWVDQILDVFDFPSEGWGNLPPAIPRGIFTRTLLLNKKIHLYTEFEKLSTINDLGYLEHYIQLLSKKVTGTKQNAPEEINKKTLTESTAQVMPEVKNHVPDLATGKPVLKTQTGGKTTTSNTLHNNSTVTTHDNKSLSHTLIETHNKLAESKKDKAPLHSPSNQVNIKPSLAAHSTINSARNTSSATMMNPVSKQKHVTPSRNTAEISPQRQTTTAYSSVNSAQHKTHAVSAAQQQTAYVSHSETDINNEQSSFGLLIFIVILLLLPAAGIYFYLAADTTPSSPYTYKKEQAVTQTESAINVNTIETETKKEANLKVETKPGSEPVPENVKLTQLEPTASTEVIEQEDKATILISEKSDKIKPAEYRADITQADNEITITIHQPDSDEKSLMIEPGMPSQAAEEVSAHEGRIEIPVIEIASIKTPLIETQVIDTPAVKLLQKDELDKPVPAKKIIKEITHVVVKGDTLWAIAKKYVKDPFLYPELARLSNIKNPHRIYPGNRVRIRFTKN